MIALAIGLAGGAVSMPIVGVHLVRAIVGLAFILCSKWLYEAGMESSSKQATLGNMALAVKVTDLHGRRISFAPATGQHFAKILSGMILLIGYIMAGFTERKQALHDMIAGRWSFVRSKILHRDLPKQILRSESQSFSVTL